MKIIRLSVLLVILGWHCPVVRADGEDPGSSDEAATVSAEAETEGTDEALQVVSDETPPSRDEVREDEAPVDAEESASSDEPAIGDGSDDPPDETEVTPGKPAGSLQFTEEKGREILQALHEDQESSIDEVTTGTPEGSATDARERFRKLLASDRGLPGRDEVCYNCHDSDRERSGSRGPSRDLFGPTAPFGGFTNLSYREPAAPTWPSRVVSVGGFLGMGATEVDMGPVLMGADPEGLSNLMRERAQEGAAELKNAGLLPLLPDPHDFQDFRAWNDRSIEVEQQISNHYYQAESRTPQSTRDLMLLRSRIGRAYFGLPPVEPAKPDPNAYYVRPQPGTPEDLDARLEAFRWQTENWSSFERNASLIMLPAKSNPNPANFEVVVESLGSFARGGPGVTQQGRPLVTATAPMMPGPGPSQVRFTTPR